MGLLNGKVAVITGAARGIGKAIALKYASEGADIAFTDLNINEAAEATVKELEAYGVKVKAYASNAADFEETHKVVAEIVSEFGHIDILDAVRPSLKALSQETGETVHFVQLDGIEAVYIYKEESNQNSVRMVSKVGSRIPLYCSGVGKAMAADMDEQQIQSIWEHSTIRKLTPHTIIDYPQFLAKIKEVREKGYALDDEENELGVRCIAVGLPDYRGRAKYAFSISAPAPRMTDERLEELAQILLKTKKEILKNM